MDFKEKAIFVWDITAIDSGNPTKIIERLLAANFEAVYLHWQTLGDWRKHFSAAFISQLKSFGITVYGSAAVYGDNPVNDGHVAGAIVNQFNLAGFIFDAESGFDAKSAAASNAVSMLKAYKGMTARPSAWCWWPLYENSKGTATYHPKAILASAMKEADYGMPMAYWSWGDSAPSAISYLNESWEQWRAITDKPLIVAGRAFTGDGGTAKPEAVAAYESRTHELGAHAVTWWSMQHAILIPGCWDALAKLPGTTKRSEVMANALGMYTEDANWTNTGFDFIAGFAGKGWEDTPSNLKAIEEKANAEGKPFFAWYKFNVGFYADQQIIAEDKFWPNPEDDLPLQKLILVMQNRNVAAVVIEVKDSTNGAGHGEDPGYISYAAKKFVGRAQDWLNLRKPNVKLIVASSNEFIITKSPNMNNWVGQFNNCAVQKASKPLIASYPDASDKPNYLGVRVTCEFWRYWEMANNTGLILFRQGDAQALRSWLGLGSGTTPPTPPPPPPVVQTELEKKVADMSARMDVMLARIGELERWRKS